MSWLVRHRRKFPKLRTFLLTATTVLAIVAVSAGPGGYGGYGSAAANRCTASINVTAQSGNISHATTVSAAVQ